MLLFNVIISIRIVRNAGDLHDYSACYNSDSKHWFTTSFLWKKVPESGAWSVAATLTYFISFPSIPGQSPFVPGQLSVFERPCEIRHQGHCHAATALFNVGGLAKCAHRTAHDRATWNSVYTGDRCARYITRRLFVYDNPPFSIRKGRGGRGGGELGGWGAPCVHSLLNVSEPCSLCILQLLYTVTVQCWLFIETAFTYICMYIWAGSVA